MSYTLNFYTLPAKIPARVPSNPEQIPQYIAAHGHPVGDMSFSAGEAFLFFDSLAELTHLPLTTLLSGPVRGREPSEDGPEFGSMAREQAERAIKELRRLPITSRKELIAAAADCDFDQAKFTEKISLLADRLESCLKQDGDPATTYE